MSIDLSTRYLGLHLANPLIASAGPLTRQLDSLAALEKAGFAAVVLPSLFEEDVIADDRRQAALPRHGAEASAEAADFLPRFIASPSLVDQHCELVEAAKARLGIPVIASVNGVHPSGWTRYAAYLAEAGADAIELNVHRMAADPSDTATRIEAEVVELVSAVRAEVKVPLAVKLSPFYSALPSVAAAIVEAGADGLVLFNRFYQADIDLTTLRLAPQLSLSTSADLRLPLTWIGILRNQVPCSFALSSGVHTSDDLVKALLVGADAVMTTSAVLRHGPEWGTVLIDGLVRWLEEHEYESVAQLTGSMSREAAVDPDSYERANYRQVLQHGWPN